jgi:carboxyl-terminal processing protease
MKPLFKSIIPAASISTALIATAGAFSFFDDAPLDAAATNAAVTALTTKILESSQFDHRRLDDELAGKFLDRYLDSLDGSHMIFLKSDLEEFNKYRPKLAKLTSIDGDTKLAHVIFKRYLERLNERSAFIKESLAKNQFDFSTDETFSYDRKDAQHPANLDEAKSIWEKQLKYEYLQEKLAGKKEAEIQKALNRRSDRVTEMMRKMSENDVLEMYLEALTQVYDPHSDYFGPAQYKSFTSEMNLSLIGIGATLQSKEGYCTIASLVPGGPAERSGLIKPGDRIVGVAQKKDEEFTDIIDLPLNKAVELIRGKKNTTVHLDIIPIDAPDDSVHKTISIAREEIKIEDQQAKAQVIDITVGDKTHRIGTIDLPMFYAGEGDGKGKPTSCSADVAKLLEKLKQENVTGVILDLRRNGGGSLPEAIDLAGLFIPSGPMVQTRGPDGRTEIGADRDGKVAYDGPLVVLTSRFSASASEIVAGALQDYGRAVVVGDTATFGKGTVQTIVNLGNIMKGEGIVPGSDPGALKITISKFYRPSGKSTQLEGVKPDIVIPSLSDLPEIGESDMKNPLPWDTIPSASFNEANRVTSYMEKLRTRSSERISTAVEFSELKTEIERFKKLREEKSVSLNEEKRKKEKEELKAKNTAIKKARLARVKNAAIPFELTLKNLSKPGLTDLVKVKELPPINLNDSDDELSDELDRELNKFPAEDLILKEAQQVLIDYTDLLKGMPLAKAEAPQPKVVTE